MFILHVFENVYIARFCVYALLLTPAYWRKSDAVNMNVIGCACIIMISLYNSDAAKVAFHERGAFEPSWGIPIFILSKPSPNRRDVTFSDSLANIMQLG